MNTFAVVTIFIFFNTLSLSISFICVPIGKRGGEKMFHSVYMYSGQIKLELLPVAMFSSDFCFEPCV